MPPSRELMKAHKSCSLPLATHREGLLRVGSRLSSAAENGQEQHSSTRRRYRWNVKIFSQLDQPFFHDRWVRISSFGRWMSRTATAPGTA